MVPRDLWQPSRSRLTQVESCVRVWCCPVGTARSQQPEQEEEEANGFAFDKCSQSLIYTHYEGIGHRQLLAPVVAMTLLSRGLTRNCASAREHSRFSFVVQQTARRTEGIPKLRRREQRTAFSADGRLQPLPLVALWSFPVDLSTTDTGRHANAIPTNHNASQFARDVGVDVRRGVPESPDSPLSSTLFRLLRSMVRWFDDVFLKCAKWPTVISILSSSHHRSRHALPLAHHHPPCLVQRRTRHLPSTTARLFPFQLTRSIGSLPPRHHTSRPPT